MPNVIRAPHSAHATVGRLEQEVISLRKDVSELSGQVHGLVEAWNAARGLVKFVQLIGSISVALAATWAIVRYAIFHGGGR